MTIEEYDLGIKNGKTEEELAKIEYGVESVSNYMRRKFHNYMLILKLHQTRMNLCKKEFEKYKDKVMASRS